MEEMAQFYLPFYSYITCLYTQCSNKVKYVQSKNKGISRNIILF